jgi:aminoglycoside phosphotransferase (APT) family kinase protein
MRDAQRLRTAKLADGKFDVSVDLVRRLIEAQFPQWAHLPVWPVDHDGWDNWSFRLGDHLKVRLPSAAGYAAQAEKEASWLPKLAPHLPLAVPVPIGVGEPGEGFPWRWSVYDWLDGETATPERIGDLNRFGREVAGFLTALQKIETTGGPPAGQDNYFRGGPISVYADEARRSIAKLEGVIDVAAGGAVIDEAVAAEWQGPLVWVHGDVAAGNLLVKDGRLHAVIDFGCAAVGDPACDLVIAWVFLDGAARAAFKAVAPADPAMWARARGWALWKAALVLAAGGVANPAERSFNAVIEDVISDWRDGPSDA